MKQWLQRISVSKKLVLIMILASLVVGSGTLFFIIATTQLGKQFDLFEKQSFVGVKTVLETEKELNYFSRVTREIMLGGDLNENLEKLDKTHKRILDLFQTMEMTNATEDEKNICQQAKKDSIVFIDSSKKLMHTLESNNQNLQEMYRYYHKNFSPLAKSSRDSMGKLVEAKINEAHFSQESFKESIVLWGTFAAIGGVFGVIVMISIMLLISSQIKNSLFLTQQGLLGFFDYLSGKEKNAQQLPDLGNDEFGVMAIMINRNIANLQLKFDEQQQSIIDFNSVCSYASKGFLFHRITAQYQDENLAQLALSLNTLLDEIESSYENLITTLTSFAQGNYNYSISKQTGHLNGSFSSVQNAISTMGVSNSEIFSLISKFSREFNNESNILNVSGDDLSTSANQQASSLEETAAAIEELTSNVSANAAKADEMTTLAKEAKHAAEHGNAIANESLSAMSEIVNATEAINQAVEIIDNIAFQTNILSLNAAVEAATAGDAGKGFAVVAQEVRNLANRSADAAAQIQQLAQTARTKSHGGLVTSQNMMDNFKLISQKIALTDNIVRDVANASREQMAGISQINDAVSQLDQMTQQNAKTANNVAQIANEILIKTEQFETMLSRIKIDEAYVSQSCATDMIFDTAKLKLDHVTFKETNYRKLKREHKSAWTVANHHECALGKWLDTHANEPYAQTSEWKALLHEHEQVHSEIQEFIKADINEAAMEDIFAVSSKIEKATDGVFLGLDRVKKINCNHN